MPSAISIDSEDVLLAIDLQADFMPGGALAVDRGDEIVPLVNRLASRFENVVVTQDWHPPGMPPSPRATQEPSPLRRGASPTAIRPYGPSIACRERRARRFTRTSRSTAPF